MNAERLKRIAGANEALYYICGPISFCATLCLTYVSAPQILDAMQGIGWHWVFGLAFVSGVFLLIHEFLPTIAHTLLRWRGVQKRDSAGRVVAESDTEKTIGGFLTVLLLCFIGFEAYNSWTKFQSSATETAQDGAKIAMTSHSSRVASIEESEKRQRSSIEDAYNSKIKAAEKIVAAAKKTVGKQNGAEIRAARENLAAHQKKRSPKNEIDFARNRLKKAEDKIASSPLVVAAEKESADSVAAAEKWKAAKLEAVTDFSISNKNDSEKIKQGDQMTAETAASQMSLRGYLIIAAILVILLGATFFKAWIDRECGVEAGKSIFGLLFLEIKVATAGWGGEKKSAAARIAAKRFKKAAASYGNFLNNTNTVGFIQYLSKNGGSATVAKIMFDLSLDAPNLAEVVNPLIERGIVADATTPEDGMLNPTDIILLSERGQNIAAQFGQVGGNESGPLDEQVF